MTDVNGTLFFTAFGPAGNRELWAVWPEREAIAGDLNDDGLVDRRDVATLIRNLGISAGATSQQGDLDDDGLVTLADLVLLQQAISAALPSPEAITGPLLASSARTPSRHAAIDVVFGRVTRPESRATRAARSDRHSQRRQLDGVAVEHRIIEDTSTADSGDRNRRSSRSLRARRSRLSQERDFLDDAIR